MTKTQAIKETLDETTKLYRFSNQWRFNYYDCRMKAWRESYPKDYWNSRSSRKIHMIETCRKKLNVDGNDYIDPSDCVGGSWKSYI
jgi:hypothetical protein